jgi:hypothetical protein
MIKIQSILLAATLCFAGTFNAKAELGFGYKILAQGLGDLEALYAYDDLKAGRYPDLDAAVKRFRSGAVSAGAETEAEVNEFLSIACQEMNRKFNLYRSLAN